MSEDPAAEPRRWLDDPDAPAEMRADLEAMRSVGAPALDEAAGLAALQARIRAQGGSGGGGGVGAAKGLAVVLGVVSVIGLGAWLALRTTTSTSEPTPSATASNEPLPIERASIEVPTSTNEPTPGASLPDERREEIAVIEATPTEPVIEAAPSDAPTRSIESTHRDERALRGTPEDRLRREMQLLEEARRTVEHDPAAALAALATARREIGTGTFGDERDALRALALFALHRDAEARPLAERILRRDPNGLYAARLRAALASAP
jgi:hypothetical protein